MIDTKAIRSKILDAAVRGLLTQQLPEDGTAEELYQQIQKEKQKLIESGKIKREKPYSESPVFQPYPFDIPENWKFVRFGELMINRDSERIPVSVAERKKRKKIYDYYGASGVIDGIDDFLFDKDLLLIGEDGANLYSRSTPIAFIASGKYWVNNHAHVLDVCTGVILKYVCYYINAISLDKYITGSAQPKMNQENMNAIWVPLPPLAEQRRIVERIEQVFSVLDEIDELQARYADNLAALRSKLIDAAIQGKLTEQLPEDGTAEELYQQIQKEKQKLIEAGKIKKEKPLPEITEDEIPFEIPENWKWVRIAEIASITSGGTPSRTNSLFWNGNIPWVKISDISAKYVTETEEKITEAGLNSSSAKIFSKGTLLYTIFATIGTVGILNIDAATNQAIAGLTFIGEYNLDYLYHILVGLKDIFVAKGKGMTQMNINQTILKNTPIPLPPLSEQRRIVERLDELLALCGG